MQHVSEHDMSNTQRRLIDNCFDEGQYEIGIATLNGLRHPSWRPCPHLIRQLIYLALYPPLDPSEQSAEVSKDNGVPEFPNELGALGDKQVLIPTLSASIAAQDLLLDFASTNSPEAMFRGLPTYPVPGSDPAPNDVEEEQDSFIARHSKCIKAARNCWEILREGFIQRQVEDFVVPRKGRGRRKRLNDDGNGLDMSRLSFDSSNPVVVGKHSWPVLQWFLAIFEREETLAKERDQPQYAWQLLAQIPPPRTGMGGRWDVEAPLQIICYCAQQQEERQRLYGVRLLALLLNLINSSQLNTNMFLDITYRHIYGLPFEDFTYLLGGLPLTDIVLQFKLNVYTNRLSEMSSDSLPAPKRKPQPRVVPRPASGRSKSSGASTPTLSSKPSSGTSTPRTNKFPTPSSTEIIRLLAMARSWIAKQGAESGLRAMDMRYQLVQTYVTLQPQGWEPLFENGELAQAAEDAFTVSEGDEEIQKSSTRYRRLLQVRLSVMKPKRS